jgi:hypothetical protein
METTLLKPGDIIRIREDIKPSVDYKMIFNEKITNTWIQDDMLLGGTLVEIKDIHHGQYRVESFNEKANFSQHIYDQDDFWLYTDQMFDPEMIQILLEDRTDY